MLPRLIVRADATTQIGIGHVMRCLALAQEWSGRGGDVVFASHIESPALREIVTGTGFVVTEIDAPHPDPSDLATLLKLVDQKPAAVVLDNYYFDTNYQGAIRARALASCVVRDQSETEPIDADVLLNHNIDAAEATYETVPPTRILRGTDYVMLRPDFAEARLAARSHPDIAIHIFVTFGGADVHNFTAVVLRAMNEAQQRLPGTRFQVKALVGPANPNLALLEELRRTIGLDAQLLTSTDDVPGLMQWADMAVSGAGTTTWELAFMGVPAALIAAADNQLGIYRGMADQGAAVAVGQVPSVDEKRLAGHLEGLITDADRRRTLSESARTVVDGKGASRVVDAILEAVQAK